MNTTQIESPNVATARPAPDRSSIRKFMIGIVLLTAAFAVPLWRLFKLALHTEIQSHILLIPFVSLYLWKVARAHPSPPETRNSKLASERNSGLRAPRSAFSGLLPALFFALIGFGTLGAYLLWAPHDLPRADALSLVILSFLCFVYAIAFITLGWPMIRSRLFAISFLLFMIPLPTGFQDWLSVTLQRASADAADWMIALTGMPTYREGMIFQFPGQAIRVAEECSGIRSTFVLFITSLLAGHLFLRSGWKKALLALAIFPVGIARNGFRITVLSWLTVNVDSRIMDSPLHHQGGPVFFVLSLVPLFALLWLLRRSDLRAGRPRETKP